MNNKIVYSDGEVYERLNKTNARNAFGRGECVYIMSIDRNPITSLTSSHKYYVGCKSLRGDDVINTFDDLLKDFSEWLYNDGYGHIPQKYDAEHHRFSYWVRKK